MSLGPAKSKQDLIFKRQNKQKHLCSDDQKDFLQKNIAQLNKSAETETAWIVKMSLVKTYLWVFQRNHSYRGFFFYQFSLFVCF